MPEMGNVLHRTTLQYIESVILDEQMYPQSTWVHDPDLSAVEGAMPRYWKLAGDDVFVMSQPEKVTKDATDLATFKTWGKERISRDCLAYLATKYPSVVFDVINSLDVDALFSGLTNRAAYIDQLRDWCIAMMTQQVVHNTNIDGCTTLEQIEAVVWDIAALDASNPGITIAGILALTD